MIFIDANLPMYLVGAPHPHKLASVSLLERAARARERLVTDAEVLQEIVHRYVAINRRGAIQDAFDALLAVVDEVFVVDRAGAERAKSLVLGYPSLSARDAIHVAIMQQHGVTRIMSFDGGYDLVPGLVRLS
ncbi:MAG: ribonuclease [Acidobacteria bacterium RIFCSPLOWO2_02_FULL_67_36]|nr:MAG: ribonuclease [Acidobacteria bacterium RIFCSPLOWO2_02_FULL_67_36]OFW21968.1 MAG: ribonuclease [Acidobacteria bacterium RIFCSPLOWO2_12_FULL_66_21]